MKKLPFLKRPIFSKRILEVGGGHDPYQGVTHSVDKFPESNSQRATDLFVPKGVIFKEGELENIPFREEPFDFIYASHVFEHVSDPKKAASEINRIAKKGYIETPAPIWEQMSCPVPYDREKDFHTLFVWTADGNLYAVPKNENTTFSFCNCENGKLAQLLASVHRKGSVNIERLLSNKVKTTKLYFSTPISFEEFDAFQSACDRGCCAYAKVSLVRESLLTLLTSVFSTRAKKLRSVLTDRHT